MFDNESFIFREPVAVAETPHIGATNGRPVKPLNGGSAPYIPTGRAPQTTYQMVDEDDNISITTRTDDDPVRDAFKEALGSLEDNSADEDDRIVWQPRYVTQLVLISRPTPLQCSPLATTRPCLHSTSYHSAEDEPNWYSSQGHDSSKGRRSIPSDGAA